MHYFFITIFLFSCILNKLNAHSWLECVDYEDNTVAPYNKDKCNGFPRGFERQFREGFGIDTGFNSLGHENQNCPIQYSPDLYKNVKMAEYVPGQDINFVAPSKGHVAADCTNAFMPDNGIKIFRSSQPFSEDYTVPLTMNGMPHINGQIDFLGFQRCFNFCENKDKAPCYHSFKLDTGVTQSGIYNFKWVWEFNVGEYYISCFDAMINVDGSIPITNSPIININSNNSSNSTDNNTITEPPTSLPTPLVSTNIPTTQPPVTDSPTTQPPVTVSPTTQPPVTDSPNGPTITSDANKPLPFQVINRFISGMINITGWFNETLYN